jgi:hypothetical protein
MTIEFQRERVERYRDLEVDTLEEKNNSTLRTPEGWNSEVDCSHWLLDR